MTQFHFRNVNISTGSSVVAQKARKLVVFIAPGASCFPWIASKHFHLSQIRKKSIQGSYNGFPFACENKQILRQHSARYRRSRFCFRSFLLRFLYFKFSWEFLSQLSWWGIIRGATWQRHFMEMKFRKTLGRKLFKRLINYSNEQCALMLIQFQICICQGKSSRSDSKPTKNF